MRVFDRLARLRWKRGLFRVWAFGAVCWAAGGGLAMYYEIRSSLDKGTWRDAPIVGEEEVGNWWDKYPVAPEVSFSDLIPRQDAGDMASSSLGLSDWLEVFGVALIPPLIVLLVSATLFLVLRWIARGFRPSSQPSQRTGEP